MVQSVRALATGGPWGGPPGGIAACPPLLDSIIAPIGERLGLMGTATVSLYGILLAQIRRIYLRAPAASCPRHWRGRALVGQAIVIAGGRLLPLTGDLPLVSYAALAADVLPGPGR